MEKWFYTSNGGQTGPVTAETLRDLETQGVLNSASLVWCQDLPPVTEARSPWSCLPLAACLARAFVR